MSPLDRETFSSVMMSLCSVAPSQKVKEDTVSPSLFLVVDTALVT